MALPSHPSQPTATDHPEVKTGGRNAAKWLSLETMVVMGFAVMFLLLGAISWISLADTGKMKQAITWLDRTHEINETLKELELDLREAESALRTYLITGDVSQKEEYRRQVTLDMETHLHHLRALTREDADQQRILEKMAPLLKERVELMEQLREVYESQVANFANSASKAQQQALDQAGAELTSRLLRLFDEFVARDRRLLSSRIRMRESNADLVRRAVLVGGFLGAGCLAVSLFAILRGLRQQRKTRKELRASLEEKEILLKEIHHRVKNNLQVISSLLSLQSEKVADPQAHIVFKECRDRIHLMARLHQQLYNRRQYGVVDFGEHLQELASMLVRSHMPQGCEVELEMRNEALFVDLDVAISLGLLANELVLNSLKHAYADRSRGLLRVSLKGGATTAEMIIEDDGRGVPEGFSLERGTGLGLELVRGLTRQIRGEVQMTSPAQGGTCTTLRFPSNPAPDSIN